MGIFSSHPTREQWNKDPYAVLCSEFKQAYRPESDVTIEIPYSYREKQFKCAIPWIYHLMIPPAKICKWGIALHQNKIIFRHNEDGLNAAKLFFDYLNGDEYKEQFGKDSKEMIDIVKQMS